MNSAPTPETINSLHQIALQQIKADIITDKMWMTLNPQIILISLIVVVFLFLVVVVNEIIAHKNQRSYESDTRVGINFGACLMGVAALITAGLFALGYFNAASDYNFKTQSPDAAAYHLVINYLYTGT